MQQVQLLSSAVQSKVQHRSSLQSRKLVYKSAAQEGNVCASIAEMLDHAFESPPSCLLSQYILTTSSPLPLQLHQPHDIPVNPDDSLVQCDLQCPAWEPALTVQAVMDSAMWARLRPCALLCQRSTHYRLPWQLHATLQTSREACCWQS